MSGKSKKGKRKTSSGNTATSSESKLTVSSTVTDSLSNLGCEKQSSNSPIQFEQCQANGKKWAGQNSVKSNAEKMAEGRAKSSVGKRAEDNVERSRNRPGSSSENGTEMIEDSNVANISKKKVECGEQSLAAGSSDVADSACGEDGEDGGCGDGGGMVDYTAPVFKKLAVLNGEINRMTKDQIRNRLEELHLNTRGVKEVLKKRLKNYYKRRKLTSANMARGIDTVPWDFLVVIDFEATCQENNDHFTHEIIEFPAALIDVQSRTVVAKFREFCRPVLNPVLSEFCKTLTGITQEEVDSAQQFKEVLHSFDQWLLSWGLGERHSFCVVTDGPWDIQRFLSMQCQVSGVPLPQWCRRWVNMRKAFTALYDTGRVNIQRMLEHLGLGFEGRPHCGMDDTLNIARIVCNMLQDGSPMKANEHLIFDPRDFVEPTHANTNSNPDSGNDHHHDNPEAGSCSRHPEGGDSKGATSQGGISGGSPSSKPQSDRKRNQAERDTEEESDEDVSDLLYYFKLQSS